MAWASARLTVVSPFDDGTGTRTAPFGTRGASKSAAASMLSGEPFLMACATVRPSLYGTPMMASSGSSAASARLLNLGLAATPPVSSNTPFRASPACCLSEATASAWMSASVRSRYFRSVPNVR